MGLRRSLSDGVVTIRPTTSPDVPVLVAGRDEEFHRFLGDGDPNPNPAGCIVVGGGTVVGWVDYDHDRTWLDAGEVNVGYNVFAAYRGRGYATRAVLLLLQHLREDTDWRTATLLIHPDNARSLALARRAGFEEAGHVDGERYWKRPIRPPSAAELGPWSPLEVDQVVSLFSPAGFRWWISGGRALALHVGHSWRPHGDTDVGIQRRDAPEAFALLAGWDLQVAAAGRLTPWHGEPLDEGRHENNVWCRPGPGEPWALDLTIGEGTDREWVYRRDRSVRLRWDSAVLRTAEGVPYLAPEVQLLFKSTNPRPKDDLDAAVVVPELDGDRRRRLARWLPTGHLAAAPAVARGAAPLSRRRAGRHVPHGCARIVRMRRVLLASAGSLGEVRDGASTAANVVEDILDRRSG